MQVAMVQMQAGVDVETQCLVAQNWVAKAAGQGADLVVLPEMFACPYDTAVFPRYAQKQGGELWQTLGRMAQENQVYLVAGSVPELGEDGQIFNTSYVFSPQGEQIAKHRKVYLFEIDIPGGQYFKESDTLSAGNSVTVFDTVFGKMGLMICFDIRFPQLFQATVDRGALAVFVPAAFNPSTGPAHWELLFRSRAMDGQCFAVGVSTAEGQGAYRPYGHSIAVNPWGTVLHQMDHLPGMVMVELDLSQVAQVRQQLPVTTLRKKQRMCDV